MKVYLAGRITGVSDADIFDWRDVAVRLLDEADMVPVDPASAHMSRRSGRQWEEKDDAYRHIVETDLEMVSKCDVLLANCTHPSWGTAMEISHAYRAGKKVCLFRERRGEPWSAFLLYFSHAQFDGLDKAVVWLKAMLAVNNQVQQPSGGDS